MPGVVFEAERPRETAEFWAALLAGEVLGGDGDRQRVRFPDGPTVSIVPATAAKAVKNRIHLDLASGAVDDGGPGTQQAIVDRAKRLGATHVDIGQFAGPAPVPWQVLADPAGNEFCVLEPRPEYSDTGPLAAVVIESPGPHRLAEFWSGVTEWPVVRTERQFVSLRAPSRRGPWLELLSADPCPPVTPRCRLELAVHTEERRNTVPDARPDLDRTSPGPGEFAAEADRLRLLGATRRGAGRLTDPDGTVIDLVPRR